MRLNKEVNMNARLQGTHLIEAPAGQSVSAKWPADADYFLNGSKVVCEGANIGDNLDLEVMDGVNVIRWFAKGWPANNGIDEIVLYVAKIYQGYDIRVTYHNTGLSDAKCHVGLFLHEELA